MTLDLNVAPSRQRDAKYRYRAVAAGLPEVESIGLTRNDAIGGALETLAVLWREFVDVDAGGLDPSGLELRRTLLAMVESDRA